MLFCVQNGMPAKIYVFKRLCYPLNTLSALKYLSPPDRLRVEFHNYFEIRISVIATCRFHGYKLMLESDNNNIIFNEKYSNNPSINFTKRTVQHSFEVCRKLQ